VRAAACLAAGLAAMSFAAHGQAPAKVYAAGSLRAALTEAAQAFAAHRAGTVQFEFGPSGLLRDRLAKGESADVFASANMEHPRSLADAGRAAPVRMFARNRMCALAPAKAGVTTDNVLDRILDPNVKLGTSTPKADPSGDYAWKIFERAGKVKPGSFETLSKKALQLVGGPGSPPPPAGRSAYAALVAGGQADVFLTYCTNAVLARKEEPSLAVVQLPESLAVGADYGLTTINGASPTGMAFAEFLLSAGGRKVLESQGFAAP
jgi:molybdenum ABC transporter molybdate-binding protein